MVRKIYVIDIIEEFGGESHIDTIFWDKEKAFKEAQDIIRQSLKMDPDDDSLYVNVYEQVPDKYGVFTTIKTHYFKPQIDH